MEGDRNIASWYAAVVRVKDTGNMLRLIAGNHAFEIWKVAEGYRACDLEFAIVQLRESVLGDM